MQRPASTRPTAVTERRSPIFCLLAALAVFATTGCPSTHPGDDAPDTTARSGDTATDTGEPTDSAATPRDAATDGPSDAFGGSRIPHSLNAHYSGTVDLTDADGNSTANTDIAAELVESRDGLRGILTAADPDGSGIYFNQTVAGEVSADRRTLTLEFTPPRCGDQSHDLCLDRSDPMAGDTVLEARGHIVDGDLVFDRIVAREPLLERPAQSVLMRDLRMAPNGGFKPSNVEDGGMGDSGADGSIEGDYQGRGRGLPGLSDDSLLGTSCSMTLERDGNDELSFADLECAGTSFTDESPPRRLEDSLAWDPTTGHIGWLIDDGQNEWVVVGTHAGATVAGIIARRDAVDWEPSEAPIAPSEVDAAAIEGSFSLRRKD